MNVPPAAAAPVPPFDRRSEDVGNIVEFGHVNLRVPDPALAIEFYVVGLGLTRDPYRMVGNDNAWINVGRCQFHLPTGAAQRFRGAIGLVVPDLDALERRLARVAPRLAGTRFEWHRYGAHVDVTCPWGNRLRVHAPDAARFGAVRLGMPYLEIDVAAGSAAAIAAFYAEVLGAPARVATDAAGAFAQVAAGIDAALLLRETPRPLAPYDGHHIQIAVADFSGVHRRLVERGLVTEESSRHQYRFQDIVDPRSGLVVATLEHEVRSMRHPMYARTLVNRNPDPDRPGADADEAFTWRSAPAG